MSKRSRRKRYLKKRRQATPAWANCIEMINLFKKAAHKRKLGIDAEIDHIVPLNHPHVCGLHWEGNMRIISSVENQIKSNHYWPDMWHEQFELVPLAPCEQYELAL